jgi:bifunctional DNase/RNase
MRRVDITGIALEAHSGAPLVVLREQDEPHRLLPIFIGAPEASAIAIAATGQKLPVPLVYDVMAALVKSLDGQVSAVEVNDLRDGTFFATINLTGPAGTRRVGSRPSDALALAVRTGAPVFVSEGVLDVAGTLPSPDEPPIDEPALDPAAIDVEVDSFRSFLDDLDPDDFIDTDATETRTDTTDTETDTADTDTADTDGTDTDATDTDATDDTDTDDTDTDDGMSESDS